MLTKTKSRKAEAKPKPTRPVTKKEYKLKSCKVTFTFHKKRVTKADLESAVAELTELLKAS